LTEITAVPGLGALALPPEDDADSPLPPLGTEERPVEVEPPADGPEEEVGASSLSCCAKGSLLANRLKDESWPSATGGAEDDASDESVEDVDAGASLPPSVGAARLGVPAVVDVSL
jgi:hypothetical protein